jgi:wyosine [tRNA(Phe)-imidazoG37] synthetase (radical SAM superfamily)
MSIIFGPIPSRRLGRSLGVNNIPPKHCTYSCVYCQAGLTNHMTATIRSFYTPNEIFNEVKDKIKKLKSAGEKVDYITFVPDGEPTLDINLGITIEKLKTLEIKIAVITNSSLIYDKNIREELTLADWVSLKIDTVYTSIWKRINRPYGSLRLAKILEGIVEFAWEFKGELVTETMLVKGINDGFDSLCKTAEFIKGINPGKAFILAPTRPPAEQDIESPDEKKLNAAYQIFNDLNIPTELLIYNEGLDFTYSSNVEKELLSILAVHPMRKDAVEEFMKKADANNGLLASLLETKTITEVQYNNNIFYVKNIRR